jgi:hypothetical protein
MPNASFSDPNRSSPVNLIRSSHPWTKADSAAGFVLRYLTPMRRQLTATLGSVEDADEALQLLLNHLINAGFGDHRRGRLRDFIVRGLRSAAKARVNEVPESRRDKIRLDDLTADSKEWLSYWREGLLERAWRSLERLEHASPDSPYFSLLHSATANPQATPEMLVVQIATDTDHRIDVTSIREHLLRARSLFAQLLADEVAETLEGPSDEDVRHEMKLLDLSRVLQGIQADGQQN